MTEFDQPVSVIIPYSPKHTPEGMLEEAKRSISTQSVPTKVLVMNDTNQEGPAAMRNVGLDRSDTRYVAFIDADDLWHENKLERQLSRLRETGTGICVEAGPITKDDFIYELFVGDINEVMSSIVIDTNKLDHRFNQELKRWEDHLFALEAASISGVCSCRNLFQTRSHDDSLSAGSVNPSHYRQQAILYTSLVADRVPEARPYLTIFYKHMFVLLGVYTFREGDYRRSMEYFSRSLQLGLSPYSIVGLLGSTVCYAVLGNRGRSVTRRE